MTEMNESTDDGRASRTAVGVGGGLLATLVMTVFRMPTAKSLPPTAEFLSRWVGGAPDDYPVSSLVLHFGYGVAAGVLFALGCERRIERSDRPETAGLAVGVAYGAALSVVGERVVLRYLVGQRLDADESAVFHAGHLMYGLTLGVWAGSRD
jgi:hypothetical protein